MWYGTKVRSIPHTIQTAHTKLIIIMYTQTPFAVMAKNTVALNYLFEYNQYQYLLVGYLLSLSIVSARRKCRPTAVYLIATVAFDTNYL